MKTLNVKLGVLLIIAAMVSACAGKKYEAKPQPLAFTKTDKEVCDVPLFYRTLKDSPVKPKPEGDRKFPTNRQLDIYWKTEIGVTRICELACTIRDILFICTEAQDKLVNPPKQCLDAEGKLKCN